MYACAQGMGYAVWWLWKICVFIHYACAARLLYVLFLSNCIVSLSVLQHLSLYIVLYISCIFLYLKGSLSSPIPKCCHSDWPLCPVQIKINYMLFKSLQRTYLEQDVPVVTNRICSSEVITSFVTTGCHHIVSLSLKTWFCNKPHIG